MRIILYTGKGGVGKTTLSAATGLKVAQQGLRTLVISTDPAHSLSDSFDCALGAEPTLVAPGLWGQEINVLQDIQKYWGDMQASLSALLMTKGLDDVVADELAVLPGMEEVCSLLHVDEKANSGEFDCIILDCAPTGETIRLISLPDILEWYIEKVFSFTNANGILKPLLKTAMAIPGYAISKSLNTLFGGVARAQKRLLDPEQTTIRVVMMPEKMVLKEALRSYTYFALFGYHVDAIVINRVIGEQWGDSAFMRSLYQMQQPYIQQAHDSFAPIPLFQLPYAPGEIVGLTELEKIGQHLYVGANPADILFEDKIQEISKEADGYILKRHFPAFERQKFDLRKKGDELILSIGNVRRSIILPQTLALLEPRRAEFNDGELWVWFD